MAQPNPETKPNGFSKKCRDCGNEIYLHRGSSGPWRAFDANPQGDPPEWHRHRCPAGLQDAELLGIIAPPGSKPADLHPKLRRLSQDFLELADQAEKRLASS